MPDEKLPKMPPNSFIASFDRFNVFAEGGKPFVKITVSDDNGHRLDIDMTIPGAATLMRSIEAALEMAQMPAIMATQPRPQPVPQPDSTAQTTQVRQ